MRKPSSAIIFLEKAQWLGFNRNEPTADDLFPDAWCNDCELIRAEHGGWNEESEKLAKISLLCSGLLRARPLTKYAHFNHA